MCTNFHSTTVQNETAGFEIALACARHTLEQRLSMPIISPHDVAWRDLGDLHICILKMPTCDNGATPQTTQAAEAEHDITGLTAATAPGAKTLWSGTLALRDMLRKRQADGSKSRPDALSVKLTCPGSAGDVSKLRVKLSRENDYQLNCAAEVLGV